MSSSDNDQVELFHRINRLKAKAGGDPNSSHEGALEPGMIEKADELIADFCKDCDTVVKHVLEKLSAKWKEMADAGPSSTREKLAQEVFTLAHEIKDIAGMCGYTLMSDFGESLRDYIIETKLDRDAQRIIVQAHVDAMNAAFRHNIRDDGGPAAQELKALVKVAIEKHS
ncbi:MAG: Hpt domain-containing protein [Alphaproteobacteria bacterium]|nr:Hpt domain-containing protein [Alphaproteobacteria bacterium]MCD8520121.1 Hpt domain-containing protein [Alphaproteobacteria bacterium]MCD8525940.1 Hpt domain-containing protein [Alphaproteobacteria bacterium]MCD8571090.1 Hpt domain-containing protein [Alphaproteobacteria bacterium]